MDTEKGLLTPVIKDAGDLSIAGLARKIADVAERTRTNKIGPDELSGGTFTMTNTGSRGALFDTPIINQPQVAILGTGAVVKRPVVIDDPNLGETIAVRQMVYLALTYDHRLVDGADAAPLPHRRQAAARGRPVRGLSLLHVRRRRRVRLPRDATWSRGLRRAGTTSRRLVRRAGDAPPTSRAWDPYAGTLDRGVDRGRRRGRQPRRRADRSATRTRRSGPRNLRESRVDRPPARSPRRSRRLRPQAGVPRRQRHRAGTATTATEVLTEAADTPRRRAADRGDPGLAGRRRPGGRRPGPACASCAPRR